MLRVRQRILGEEHPDTTISAWNLFNTLMEMYDSTEAGTVLKNHLLCLLDRDPESLGANQQQIREMFSQMI